MYDGVIVSFPGGARGRFLANIISKNVDDNKNPVEYTKYNSAHTTIENVFIRPLFSVDDFTLNLGENTFGATPIVVTHLFYDNKWLNNEYLKNKKIVIISVSENDIDEIILNQAIKNIFPRIEMIANNEPLNPREILFMDQYKSLYKRHGIELGMDTINVPEQTLEFFNVSLNEPLFKNHIQKSFYGITVPDSDRVLNIQYHTLFDIDNNGRYVVLKAISEWLGTEYRDHAHQSYKEYDEEKYKIFEKYCPWFLEGMNKFEQRTNNHV